MADRRCDRWRETGGRGFSVLELMVALAIMGMVLAVVLSLFDQMTKQSVELGERLDRQAAIENCLARIMEDIANAGPEAEIKVTSDSRSWQPTGRITISVAGGTRRGEKGRRIEWVAAPRYAASSDEEELVLFRREERPGQRERSLYVPLCEHLYSFEARMLDAGGLAASDPNAPGEVVEVVAEVYQFAQPNPDQVFTVRRTFCRQRF